MFLKDLAIPDKINDFKINSEAAEKIQKLFTKDFIPNLYIYGASGSGKYTLFIKNLEKIVEQKIVINQKVINISNQWANVKEVNIPSSDYHFEINLSKYSNNKNNLFSIIDQITESREINAQLDYKLILIRNIHSASNEFIKFIKQKAETLIDYVRFIVIGKTNSNNLRSLNGVFFNLRIPKPDTQSIIDLIQKVKRLKRHGYKASNFKQLDFEEIIESNNNNLNLIFTKIELLLLNNFYKTKLELVSEKIIKLLNEKKISNLYEIREIIYEYQTNNQDFDILLLKILDYYLKCGSIKDEKKNDFVRIMANTNINLKKSFKEVVHIEDCFLNLFGLIHS